MGAWADPFAVATRAVMGMGLLNQAQPADFRDKTDRDLLIRLSVQMDHLRRAVVGLAWAVGIMLAGIVPLSLILAFYAAALWVLWRGGP